MTGAVAAIVAAGSAFTPVSHAYSTGVSQTETIPIGATSVVIEAWGGSGTGGTGFTQGCVFRGGGGGASGGYAKTVLSAVGGQTMTYTVGAIAGSSTVSSGTFGLTAMTANGAPNGDNAASNHNGSTSTGGTASGGNTTNTTGNGGGAGGVCVNGAGGAGIVGTNSTGSSGGNGGVGNSNTGRTIGGSGLVIFAYT